MAETEEFPVPDELAEVFLDYRALIELRDKYVNLRYFGVSAAIRCAKAAERKRDEFWRLVHGVYPELSGDATYNYGTRTITKKENTRIAREASSD